MTWANPLVHCPDGPLESMGVGGMSVSAREARIPREQDVMVGPGSRWTPHGLWWAHEVKTMLAVMQMSLVAIQRKAPSIRELAAREFETVEASLRRGIALLEAALAVPGASQVEGEPVSVPELLHSAADMLRTAARGRSETKEPIEIAERYDPAVPVILGDRRLLEAAFVNVAFNSLQAIAAGGGRIEFSAVPTQGGLNVCIRDTGPGFRRTRLSRARPIEGGRGTGRRTGTGWGLRIAREAVERHGGRLVARDLEPRGAEVSIMLPIHG